MDKADGLNHEERALVQMLGGYSELAEELGGGVTSARVRTWWTRDNYRIRELACRPDLSPPLFLIGHAADVLRERMGDA